MKEHVYALAVPVGSDDCELGLPQHEAGGTAYTANVSRNRDVRVRAKWGQQIGDGEAVPHAIVHQRLVGVGVGGAGCDTPRASIMHNAHFVTPLQLQHTFQYEVGLWARWFAHLWDGDSGGLPLLLRQRRDVGIERGAIFRRERQVELALQPSLLQRKLPT